MSSWLIQVTCVPAFTVTTPGVNAKLSILTSVTEPADASAEAAGTIPEAPPGSDAEDADAALIVITDTIAMSARALHVKSADWLVLILLIIPPVDWSHRK